MSNTATTDVAVHDLIRNRWSPRAFSNQSVSPETLRSLFEAARWAASSSNEQPWIFIAARKEDTENFAKLLSVLVEFNSGWAKHAAVLALAVARLNTSKGDKPNRSALYDLGAASAQLTFQASAQGLFVHQMGGFDADKAREVFKIPEGFQPIAALAMGYLGNPESLPDQLRERELATRTRKPLSEFVMAGEWGHTAPFLGE